MKTGYGLILIASFLSISAHARPWAEIKKEGVLLVATEGAFPPFNFIKNKKLQGFEVDLVDEMAKRLGVKTKWVTEDFDNLLLGLFENHYDLVAASHAKTEGRENAVDFLPPHYCSGGEIVSLKGGAKTLADLKGKKVGVQLGSMYAEFLDKNASAKEIVNYPTDPAVVDALSKQQIDAAITDRFMVKQFLKRTSKLQAGDVVIQEKNAMAVKKGNNTLLKKLTEALKTVQKDGTYRKISLQYFNEDIRCHGSER